MLAACLTLLLLIAAYSHRVDADQTNPGIRTLPHFRGLLPATHTGAEARQRCAAHPEGAMDRPQLAKAATTLLHGTGFVVQSTLPDVAARHPTAASGHPVLAVVLSRPLIGHLHHLAQRVTDGDFESLVIWGELAHRCLAHLLPDPTDPRQWMAGLAQLARDPGQARAIHVSALVEAVGIPRETVRRKLERLAEQGNVRRVTGGWVICPLPTPSRESRSDDQ